MRDEFRLQIPDNLPPAFLVAVNGRDLKVEIREKFTLQIPDNLPAAFVVAVNGRNFRVEIHPDGRVVAYTNGDARKLAPDNAQAPANPASRAMLKVGGVMPEGHDHAGWIYGGISKTTNEPFCIAPSDSGVMRWQEAMDFAARRNASVPSHEELNQMYEARNEGALKGTFNTTGSPRGGRYWSSSHGKGYARSQCFSDGDQKHLYKRGASSLRCVRR